MCLPLSSNASRPALMPAEHTPDFHQNGSGQDTEVHARSATLDILQIRAKPLINAGVTAPAPNLRQTCQPWPHCEPPAVVGKLAAEDPGVRGHLRTRAYQRHIAFEHIPQLRQFIQVETAQVASETRARRKFVVAPVVR